ncbi:MAG TPA: response regulator [Vicinamibacterales bacterium]|nr:response regulator [Vicinamibacterales bacterium]
MTPDDQLMTTEQVLEYLHLNLKTVYRLINAGKLPAVRVGRQWRFKKRDLDAWLNSGAPAAAAAHDRSSLLVVEDEDAVRDLIATTLTSADARYDVTVAPDGPSALTMLRARSFDVLVTDLKMPGMDGMTLIREARAIAPELPVVIITAVPSQSSAIDAVNLGVSGYLTKPFRMPQMLSVIAKAAGR